MAEYYRAPIGYEEIDALCDIYVFCMNSLKLEDIFVKDRSPEAVTKWYKADYSRCRIMEQ